MSLTYDAGARALHTRSVDLNQCGAMLMHRAYEPDPAHTWHDVTDFEMDAVRRPLAVRMGEDRFDADDPEPWVLPFGTQPGGMVIYAGQIPLFYLDAPDVRVSYAPHFHPQGIAV